MKQELTELQQNYLDAITDDWYVPFNGIQKREGKGAFDFSDELAKMGYLEKEKMGNGFFRFRKTNKVGGYRNNSGKLRWSLVDFEALEDMVRALEHGEKEYGEDNWKKGLKTHEIFESLMRHLIAYIGGEDIDPESGLPHTGHILSNAMFLAYMHKFKPEFDTRKNKK